MRQRRRVGLSRRKLLQTLGVSTVLSPLIPLLNASGQEAARPKRLLLFFTPDGVPSKDWNTTVDWRPKGTETDFTFSEIHSPLQPFMAKMVVPWGLTMTAGGAGEQHAYGMAGLWTASTLHEPHAGADFDGGNGHRTGWGSGPSIDQIVARAYGPAAPYRVPPDDPNQETPYRSLELGVQTGGVTSLTRMIYAGDKQPLHPETNPRAAFDRIFAGVDPSGSGSEDPAAARTRLERQAVVDRLKGDLTRIRTRIGSEEHQKLDAHLEGLLAIERRLSTTPTAMEPALGCTIPERPGDTRASNANYPDQIRQMMDIVAHALACDVTRVASLQLSYGFSGVTHTWLGHNTTHHTMSHDNTDRRADLSAIDKWYSGHFAYLLEKLDSVPEGDGTLLDNTLIVWGRELGSTVHRMDRVPFLMAGGAAGALRTGRNLNFDKQPHAKLLVSVAQIMGVETNSVGNREPNSGPLPGLV
ncbi:MAG: DUF1552 domain-containing protein [Pseudomonadota bacterium]|nr:MAG: hypothetical protein DIU78_14870 [Pseudomonadota bacterium]